MSIKLHTFKELYTNKHFTFCVNRFLFPMDDFYLKKLIIVLKNINIDYNYKSSCKMSENHFKAKDTDGKNILYEVTTKTHV